MKTVLLVSSISFLLLMGGLFLYAHHQAAALSSAQVSTPVSATQAADVPTGEDIDLALAALVRQREQLRRERENLDLLRSDLQVERQGLEAERRRIEGLLQKLQGEQQRFQQARRQSTQKLAKMFEAMKPRSSAPILSALDRDIALDVLALMKDRPAAKLLAALDPSLAANLSTRLSLRGMP